MPPGNGGHLMNTIYEELKDDIREYCEENNLDFDKVLKAGKCYGKNVLFLQHINRTKENAGLKDETPAKVILIVRRSGGAISYEQTKYTQKYLGKG